MTASESAQDAPLRIAIVGPCASGKTSLARALQKLGWSARQIAQEHSYVQDMWLRLTRPDILIYLHAGFETCTLRKNLSWTQGDYDEQLRRLRHAREHCDLFFDTDQRDTAEILHDVERALAGRLPPPAV